PSLPWRTGVAGVTSPADTISFIVSVRNGPITSPAYSTYHPTTASATASSPFPSASSSSGVDRGNKPGPHRCPANAPAGNQSSASSSQSSSSGDTYRTRVAGPTIPQRTRRCIASALNGPSSIPSWRKNHPSTAGGAGTSSVSGRSENRSG